MALRLGDEVANFSAMTTDGEIGFQPWLGQAREIFFSHPKDYTPVRATEHTPQPAR